MDVTWRNIDWLKYAMDNFWAEDDPEPRKAVL